MARCSVVGATPHGTADGKPSNDTIRSGLLTSRSTRGRNRTDRQASAASAALTPSRAPWTTYSKTSGGSRVRADSSSPASQPASALIGRRSADLDAREVLLAPTQHQPRPVEQVALAGPHLGVVDPVVVDVGATLTDGPAGVTLALGQPAVDQQVDDRRELGAAVDRQRAGLAQRGAQRRSAQLRQLATAEERRRGRLRLLGLPGAVHERRDRVGQRALGLAEERLLGVPCLERLD